jgi:hypothetical protein
MEGINFSCSFSPFLCAPLNAYTMSVTKKAITINVMALIWFNQLSSVVQDWLKFPKPGSEINLPGLLLDQS